MRCSTCLNLLSLCSLTVLNFCSQVGMSDKELNDLGYDLNNIRAVNDHEGWSSFFIEDCNSQGLGNSFFFTNMLNSERVYYKPGEDAVTLPLNQLPNLNDIVGSKQGDIEKQGISE